MRTVLAKMIKKTSLVLFVVLLSGTLSAENILQISSVEGHQGDRSVRVIVTAAMDQEIHGYSIALGFPAEVLELTEITVEGTHVAPLDPEFMAPKIDNALGIGTLGVIIDFNQPLTPTALSATTDEAVGADQPPHIVARLTFDIRADAPGGLYPLRLVDGIGSPAVLNRFTNAGVSIAPTLVDGTVLVEGGNVMMLDTSFAIAGASPAITLFASVLHTSPLDGFTIAIAFDCAPEVMEYKSSTWVATDLDFLVGEPEFFSSVLSEDRPCRVETAVLFEYLDETGMVPPLPTTTVMPQTVYKYVFGAGSAADNTQQWQDLILENLDDPVAPLNQFFTSTQSVTPRRIHGKVYFSQGDLTGRVVERISGDPVSSVNVKLDPNPCAPDVPDCNSSVSTDASGVFLFQGILPGPYTATLVKGGYYNEQADGIVVSGSFSLSDAGDLPIYEVPSNVLPRTFLRGDTNNDGNVDISDSIFMLGYLFRGETSPPCNLAADANGDNKTDISDAIWALAFFFTGGPVIPPPNVCGVDPTPGSLTCESSLCGGG